MWPSVTGSNLPLLQGRHGSTIDQRFMLLNAWAWQGPREFP
jgi:hypothetical protein